MKRPTIERFGNGWRVEIYPRCFLKWWTEDRAEGGVMVIESDFPHLQRLDGGGDGDHFELPISMLPQ
jgi:hypothetical protein